MNKSPVVKPTNLMKSRKRGNGAEKWLSEPHPIVPNVLSDLLAYNHIGYRNVNTSLCSDIQSLYSRLHVKLPTRFQKIMFVVVRCDFVYRSTLDFQFDFIYRTMLILVYSSEKE
jgi:hypothetical protein